MEHRKRGPCHLAALACRHVYSLFVGKGIGPQLAQEISLRPIITFDEQFVQCLNSKVIYYSRGLILQQPA